ncbi:MAG TPA: coproporphyrinogen III oxidase family protein [Persephonella sp.]|uniref:Heme chaperone HemW n=1 Tax=Persephonella marina (strain DSM 14350 / EX-H1) TaxID=123214 RepID=C0QSF4_PERMH|nr:MULTISPECIES: radical SAM family heme chaperone HemW [Persephonella]ACO03182.1 putative oxygen-independent coproporphyrinogen III oxidase [Persephonella marina EX-H1]HCB69348.1 coproporphyrinogen III oxidase family protein [Persephonella sp.]
MIKGLYIHIPFCSIKCPYCDFVSITSDDKGLHRRYIEALKKEILLYKELDFDLETVYFGGGTPSLLDPELLSEFIYFIKDQISVVESPEITVEVNPKTYRYEDFRIIKEAGVNRISIGVQSFLERNLRMLGRDHSVKDSYKAVEDCLKSGIENINLDLIYGIQNQSLKDLEKDLEIYTSLPVKHISAYMLTPYEGTPFEQSVREGVYRLKDEDELYDMFVLINSYLETQGFLRYELSNWSKEGYQCRHNLFYWKHVPFLGIGVSAWSYINGKRSGNTGNLKEYLEKIEKGKKPAVFSETIDKSEFLKEKIFLGLRLREGVPVKYLSGKLDSVEELVSENFGLIDGDRFILTEKGLMVINRIVSLLI